MYNLWVNLKFKWDWAKRRWATCIAEKKYALTEKLF